MSDAPQNTAATISEELSLAVFCGFFGPAGNIEARNVRGAFAEILDVEMTQRPNDDFPEYTVMWQDTNYSWHSFESLVRVLMLNHIEVEEEATSVDHYMYDLCMDDLIEDDEPTTLFTPLKYRKVYLHDKLREPLFGIELFVVPYAATRPGLKELDSLIQALGALLPKTSPPKPV